MRLLTISLLFITIILFTNCEQRKTNETIPKRIAYNKALDTLNNLSFLDSLAPQFDCGDSLIRSDDYFNQLTDSVNLMYDQIIVRLDSARLNPKKRQYAHAFKQSLIESKGAFQTVNDADQNIIFYSFGDATMQGVAAKCFKINLLRQRLLFLKAAFSNAYWNYDFDTISEAKR